MAICSKHFGSASCVPVVAVVIITVGAVIVLALAAACWWHTNRARRTREDEEAQAKIPGIKPLTQRKDSFITEEYRPEAPKKKKKKAPLKNHPAPSAQPAPSSQTPSPTHPNISETSLEIPIGMDSASSNSQTDGSTTLVPSKSSQSSLRPDQASPQQHHQPLEPQQAHPFQQHHRRALTHQLQPHPQLHHPQPRRPNSALRSQQQLNARLDEVFTPESNERTQNEIDMMFQEQEPATWRSPLTLKERMEHAPTKEVTVVPAEIRDSTGKRIA